ncbi:hypothetical protein EBZ80_18835 [bacterium]|nr:hypothetical protein [bacterium]
MLQTRNAMISLVFSSTTMGMETGFNFVWIDDSMSSKQAFSTGGRESKCFLFAFLAVSPRWISLRATVFGSIARCLATRLCERPEHNKKVRS